MLQQLRRQEPQQGQRLRRTAVTITAAVTAAAATGASTDLRPGSLVGLAITSGRASRARAGTSVTRSALCQPRRMHAVPNALGCAHPHPPQSHTHAHTACCCSLGLASPQGLGRTRASSRASVTIATRTHAHTTPPIRSPARRT